MIKSIRGFITKNYPQVKIVAIEEVKPSIKEKDNTKLNLKFYDVTFEYEGKKFSKLFNDRLKKTVEQQFEEAMAMNNITLSRAGVKKS